ncbi:zinc finger and BTB domain-containing protein 49-like [Anopheles maculipalpis]|uniref:zinc finger and BTB domain-containing protein 49-like n=1 Tax=Anopheles maculipalpis TaxID=1496333 RepID=UPI0021599911|nr:zinc finger and BTB domain-containing protein 49-like [Anopheles maculipalpis]
MNNVLCRLCLMKCEELLGMYITSPNGVLRSLPKIIRECISLEITDLEPNFVSKFICNECIYKLELFYAFRQQSLKSQEYYNGLIQYYQQSVPCSSKVSLDPTTAEAVHVSGSVDSVFEPEQSVHSNNELADINFSGNEFMMDESEKHQLSKDYDDIIRNLQKDDLFKDDFTTNDDELVIKPELGISIPTNGNRISKQVTLQQECSAYMQQSNGVPINIVQPTDPSANGCFNPYSTMTVTCDKDLINSSTLSAVDQDDDLNYDDFVGIQTTPLEEDNREMSLSEVHVQDIIADVYNAATEKINQPTDAITSAQQIAGVHQCDDISALQPNDSYFSMVDFNEPALASSSSGTTCVNGTTDLANDKTCEICFKTFRTRQKLTIHRNTHLRLAPFKCTFDGCTKAFKSRIGLDEHVARHTNSFEFTCDICSKGFQHRSYLSAHRRAHNTDRNFQCALCDQSFKSKQALLDHKNRRHLGVKPFACELCDKQFTKNSQLREHIDQQHSGKQDGGRSIVRHPCQECGKQFTSKSYLNVHLRIHRNERPFVCEVCDKGHITRKDLAVHMTSHTGEKPLSCDICGKTYARRNALDCHRRTHTKERPYICDICGQSFSQATPLRVHRKLHETVGHKKQITIETQKPLASEMSPDQNR